LRSLARLARRDPDRVIEVSWGRPPSAGYEVDIELRGYDRKGLQKDVVGVISNTASYHRLVQPHVCANRRGGDALHLAGARFRAVVDSPAGLFVPLSLTA
jgi:(p)ppGpp synthase/HD superfamily hydrolase